MSFQSTFAIVLTLRLVLFAPLVLSVATQDSLPVWMLVFAVYDAPVAIPLLLVFAWPVLWLGAWAEVCFGIVLFMAGTWFWSTVTWGTPFVWASIRAWSMAVGDRYGSAR